MKKPMTVACLAVAFVASSAAPGAAALKLSLKISGGAAMLLDGAGDLDRFRQGQKALADDWARDDFRTATFNWKKMSTVPELGGEVILHVSPKLGIGLGVGYLAARAKADYATHYNQSWSLAWGDFVETETYAVKRDIRAWAIPISLNLHVLTRLSGRFNFTAQAGVAYYLGKLKQTCDVTDNYFYGYDSDDYYDQKAYYDESATTTDTAACNTFGFQGAAGLEMLLTPALSVGFEIYGRYVDFKGFKGDSNYTATSRERFWHEVFGWWYDETTTSADSETGGLYYWEWRSNYYNRDYATLGIREEAPAGPGVRGARRATINMNRVGVLITLRYRFDL